MRIFLLKWQEITRPKIKSLRRLTLQIPVVTTSTALTSDDFVLRSQGCLCVSCDSRTSCGCFFISSNKHMVVLMETKLLVCGKETGTLVSLTSCCRRLACGVLNANTMCLMLRLVLYKSKGKVHPCTGTEALYRPYCP
jgi:hypothetical protein